MFLPITIVPQNNRFPSEQNYSMRCAKTAKRIRARDAGGAKAPRRLLLPVAVGYCWWRHLVVGIQVKMGLSAGNGPRIQEREPQLVRGDHRPARRFDGYAPRVRGASRSDVGAVACHDSPTASTTSVHACVCGGIRKHESRSRSRVNSCLTRECRLHRMRFASKRQIFLSADTQRQIRLAGFKNNLCVLLKII